MVDLLSMAKIILGDLGWVGVGGVVAEGWPAGPRLTRQNIWNPAIASPLHIMVLSVSRLSPLSHIQSLGTTFRS